MPEAPRAGAESEAIWSPNPVAESESALTFEAPEGSVGGQNKATH